MPRPTDWDVLGLTSDPTPGDPEKIRELKKAMSDLAGVATEIDEALTAVLNNTNDAWVGKTADALREKINGPLREFVQSFGQAFNSAATALGTYADRMQDEQFRADQALSEGRGLSQDDKTRRDELADVARRAGESQAEAAKTAATAVRNAAGSIKPPVSDCEKFWEIFQWIAIALILPALIFGGPVALLAIGVNLTLLIKTAVDFAQGKADLLGLFLSVLGIIAPTTRAFPIFQLLGKAGKLTWQGAKQAWNAAVNFGRNLIFNLGRGSFQFLPELRGFASFVGTWTRQGPIWVVNTFKNLPSTFSNLPNTIGSGLHTGGFLIANGFRAVPGLVRNFPSYTLNAARAISGFTANGARTVWHFTVNNFGGFRWLRLVLPVDAGEISAHGLRGALRIGFVERGLFGRNVYGTPLLAAAGRGLSQIPLPPPASGQINGGRGLSQISLPPLAASQINGGRGLSQISLPPLATGQINALVDMPGHQLATVRLGDWAGPPTNIPRPQFGNGSGLTSGPSFTGLGDLSAGPSLNTPTFNSYGSSDLATNVPNVTSVTTPLADNLAMAPEALRNLDALLDMPIRELNAIRSGDLGNLTFTSTGVHGDIGLNPAALNVNTPLANANPLNAPALAGTPQATGLDIANLATSSQPLNQVTSLHVTTDLAIPNPTSPGTLDPNLLTSAAPPQVTPVHATGNLTVPGGASAALFNLAFTPNPQTALNLLASPPPLSNITDATTNVLTANRINFHLDTYAPSSAARTDLELDTLTPPTGTTTGTNPTPTPTGTTNPAPTPTGTTNPAPTLTGTTAPNLPPTAARTVPHLNNAPTPTPGTTATTTPTPTPTGTTAANLPPTATHNIPQAGNTGTNTGTTATITHNASTPTPGTTATANPTPTPTGTTPYLPSTAAHNIPHPGTNPAAHTTTGAAYTPSTAAHNLPHPGSTGTTSTTTPNTPTQTPGTTATTNPTPTPTGTTTPNLPPTAAQNIPQPGNTGTTSTITHNAPTPTPGTTATQTSVPPATEVPSGTPSSTTVPPATQADPVSSALSLLDNGGSGRGTNVTTPNVAGSTADVGHATDNAASVPSPSPSPASTPPATPDPAPTSVPSTTAETGTGAPAGTGTNIGTETPPPSTTTGTLTDDANMPAGSGTGTEPPSIQTDTPPPATQADPVSSALSLLDNGGSGRGTNVTTPNVAGSTADVGHAADNAASVPSPSPSPVSTPPATPDPAPTSGTGPVTDTTPPATATGQVTETAPPATGDTTPPTTTGGHPEDTTPPATSTGQTTETAPPATGDTTPPATGTGQTTETAPPATGDSTPPTTTGGHPEDTTPPAISTGQTTDTTPPATGTGQVTDTAPPATGTSQITETAPPATGDTTPPTTTGGHPEDTTPPATSTGQITETAPPATGDSTPPTTTGGHPEDTTPPAISTGQTTDTTPPATGTGQVTDTAPPATGTSQITETAPPATGDTTPPTTTGGHPEDTTPPATSTGQTTDTAPPATGDTTPPATSTGRTTETAPPATGDSTPPTTTGGHPEDTTPPATSTGQTTEQPPPSTVADDADVPTASGADSERPSVQIDNPPSTSHTTTHPTDNPPPTGTVADDADLPTASGADSERPSVQIDNQPSSSRPADNPPPSSHGSHAADDAPGANDADVDEVVVAAVPQNVQIRGGNGLGDLWIQRSPQGGMRVVDATGTPQTHLSVVDLGGSMRVTFTTNGLRNREYMIFNNAGELERLGVNVLKDGKPTRFMYEIDYTGPNGTATWQRMEMLDDGTLAPSGSGQFHKGIVKVSGEGTHIRLLGSVDNKIEIFERRILPDGSGGGVLDAFRRTDTVGFGHTSRAATWVTWNDAGDLIGHGVRRFDESGLSWTDFQRVHGIERKVHHFRVGITGRDPGYVLAIKGPDGNWTWHRFDHTGGRLAQGPRTWHADGGWTDRLGGNVVQEQWGKFHGPDKVGNYREYDWDPAAGRRDTWTQHSPQGKVTASTEQVGGTVLKVERWTEQRPPYTVRKYLIGADTPQGAYHHLKYDTHVQISTWERTHGNVTTNGFRYNSQNGNVIDLGNNGTFVYAEMKLYDGGKLKVGDGVAPPAQNAPVQGAIPWQASDQRGYRIPGDGGNGGPVWQDVSFENGGWRVTREGFADGSVREHHTPYNWQAGGGHLNPDTRWVQTDFHGRIVGRQDIWPDGGVPVTGTGKIDSSSWRWTAPDGQGGTVSGERFSFRGSDARLHRWDDSFRDFQGNRAIRGIDMLANGEQVRYWRITDEAGQETWRVQKFNRNGNPVSYGDGIEVRQWWDPQTRSWNDRYVGDGNHYRDVFRPADGGPQRVIREVPLHLDWTGSPLRIREYWTDPGRPPVAGTWKEFDQNAVVRERTRLPDGTFLEKEPWRSQWRVYDGNGNITAQRTANGLIFEGGPNNLRLVGNGYDYRGWATEFRGWARRIRELERLPWQGSASVEVPRFQAAIDGVHPVPNAQGGKVGLGEAAYEPYWKVQGKKMLLEFSQEFLLEFGINLAINGIIAAINNKPFTGQDALKSLANAAVTSGIKTGATTLLNDRPFSWSPGTKGILGNIDSGKHPNMRPFNSDKHWHNEWAGNESPPRWRGGIYDYTFNTLLSPITNFVNGAMNAAVWGVSTNGTSKVFSGADALAVGGIHALSGLTVATGAGALKTAVLYGANGRQIHRYGLTDYLAQAPFKLLEKAIGNIWLAPALRQAWIPHLLQPAPPPPPPPSA
ncbi:putative T7SS-secreted protein [Thermopolyspora sp. NPDC052614]|uniref:putative T7SS-secreted protein n=1 Tax=Thermopolyspora sp. NPDC052614 TaxID=3155682 RepID=UPI00343F02DC